MAAAAPESYWGDNGEREEDGQLREEEEEEGQEKGEEEQDGEDMEQDDAESRRWPEHKDVLLCRGATRHDQNVTAMVLNTPEGDELWHQYTQLYPFSGDSVRNGLEFGFLLGALLSMDYCPMPYWTLEFAALDKFARRLDAGFEEVESLLPPVFRPYAYYLWEWYSKAEYRANQWHRSEY